MKLKMGMLLMWGMLIKAVEVNNNKTYEQLKDLKNQNAGIIWLLYRFAQAQQKENCSYNFFQFLKEKPYFKYPLDIPEHALITTLQKYTIADQQGNLDPQVLTLLLSSYKGGVAPIVEKDYVMKPPAFELLPPNKTWFSKK